MKKDLIFEWIFNGRFVYWLITAVLYTAEGVSITSPPTILKPRLDQRQESGNSKFLQDWFESSNVDQNLKFGYGGMSKRSTLLMYHRKVCWGGASYPSQFNAHVV